ncbi:MAG: hypothetical protein WBQ73_01860 [Candidatus Babeliales bacterium]
MLLLLSITLCLSILNIQSSEPSSWYNRAKSSLHNLASFGRDIGTAALAGGAIGHIAGQMTWDFFRHYHPDISLQNRALTASMAALLSGGLTTGLLLSRIKSPKIIKKFLHTIAFFKQKYAGLEELPGLNLRKISDHYFWENLTIKSTAFTPDEQQTCLQLLSILYDFEIITEKQVETFSRIISTNIHTKETQDKVTMYSDFCKAFQEVITGPENTPSESVDTLTFLAEKIMKKFNINIHKKTLSSLTMESNLNETITNELFNIHSLKYLPKACQLQGLEKKADSLIKNRHSLIQALLNYKNEEGTLEEGAYKNETTIIGFMIKVLETIMKPSYEEVQQPTSIDLTEKEQKDKPAQPRPISNIHFTTYQNILHR